MGDRMTYSIFDTDSIHFLKGVELYGLGSNYGGTIGKSIKSIGNVSISHTDIPQHIAPEKQFKFVTGGSNLTVAIDTSGRVWTCGTLTNALGRPAPGSSDKRTLTPVVSQPERMTKAQVFSQGFFVLGESGRLYAIGLNRRNILCKDEIHINEWFKELTPILPHKRFLDFSSANDNLYGIDDYGDLYGWGCTDNYALSDSPSGYSKKGANYGDTLLSDGHMKFKKVVAGSHLCIALREDGRLAAIGSSASGLLTNTTSSSSLRKLTISEDEDFVFKKIYLHEGTFFGIKEDDTLWVNGDTRTQIEGLNRVSREGKLTQLGNKRWDQLSPRIGGMYGIQKDGSLWTWGSKTYSLNFISDPPSNHYYSPAKVEHITGITKLKNNMEEVEIDEFEYFYNEQKIDMTLRNRGLGLTPVHSTSSALIEVRYLFKSYNKSERLRFLKFDGTTFQVLTVSAEEAFEQGHTLAYIKENESKILDWINDKPSKRIYLVAFSLLESKTNDYFLKEVRQVINETSAHDGMQFNSRILFPGHSKNVVNKELLEFGS